MSHIFNLHLPNTATPHTLDAEPNSILVAVRVATPDAGTVPEVDVSVHSFVRLSALSPDLRNRVIAEILATVPSAAETTLSAPERQLVGADAGAVRVEPETVLHENMDSFIGALADCRAVSGELIPCDDPKSRRIGYVHHPDVGPSFVHEIGLRSIRGSTVSDEVAARIGMSPQEIRDSLSSYEGRLNLVAGRPPDPAPDQDGLLQEVMMSDPLKAVYRYEDERSVDVEFPDVDLFRSADLLGSLTPPAFRAHRARPAWMPVGWAVLKFPEDKDRASVLDDPSPVGATGAFARRGDCLFRAFDDGRWDESVWQTPADERPAGYRVVRSGNVGKPDVQAALAAVLPSYQATVPAIVRSGAP